MTRRIVGQCHNADFMSVMHLSELIAKGEEVDLTTLTKRQSAAVNVIDHFLKHHIPLKTLDRIKEVLLWELEDGMAAFEYKLMYAGDTETLHALRSYKNP